MDIRKVGRHEDMHSCVTTTSLAQAIVFVRMGVPDADIRAVSEEVVDVIASHRGFVDVTTRSIEATPLEANLLTLGKMVELRLRKKMPPLLI